MWTGQRKKPINIIESKEHQPKKRNMLFVSICPSPKINSDKKLYISPAHSFLFQVFLDINFLQWRIVILNFLYIIVPKKSGRNVSKTNSHVVWWWSCCCCYFSIALLISLFWLIISGYIIRVTHPQPYNKRKKKQKELCEPFPHIYILSAFNLINSPQFVNPFYPYRRQHDPYFELNSSWLGLKRFVFSFRLSFRDDFSSSVCCFIDSTTSINDR